MRAVLGDEVIRGHSELFEHLLGELLDAQCCLGFGDLVTVQRVGQARLRLGELAHLIADRANRRGVLCPGRTEFIPACGSRRHHVLEASRHHASRFGHGRGDGRRAHPCRGSPRRPGPCFTLSYSGPAQRISLTANGVHSLFGGAHCQARLDLDGTGLFQLDGHIVAVQRLVVE
ncbi:Uncharacterised protein [Mycobacteroides abscessus subsp. abscessus]|nr:Uncharacterised protein [Mycobacteroides abscessus subsp. abscessus]